MCGKGNRPLEEKKRKHRFSMRENVNIQHTGRGVASRVVVGTVQRIDGGYRLTDPKNEYE